MFDAEIVGYGKLGRRLTQMYLDIVLRGTRGLEHASASFRQIPNITPKDDVSDCRHPPMDYCYDASESLTHAHAS